MRQFVRSLAALAVVVLVLGGLRACSGGSKQTDVGPRVESRRIDLVARTTTIRSNAQWSVANGAMNGDATVVLDNGRVLQLVDGTLGQSTCLFPDVPDACVLLADTLGDGIVWFSLMPSPPSGSTELELPPIEELLEGVTYARLEGGLEVPLLDRVVRRCSEETPNLTSFVQKFAGRHVTILDLVSGQVSAVRCELG